MAPPEKKQKAHHDSDSSDQEDEDERREKQEFEKRYIREALELKNESGCVCYKFEYDEIRKFLPSDICGDYDVIYQKSFSVDFSQERTTRGKLVLQEEDGALHGRVDFDDALPFGIGSFSIDEQEEKGEKGLPLHSEKRWYIDFVLSDLDSNLESNFRPKGDEVLTATLRVLDERCGLPWLVDEKYDCHSASDQDKFTPYMVDTLEEAEHIAKKANDYSDSWLCNHLGVDAFVAKNIHEFVAWRPDPVLFLEPGDLLLNVEWHYDFHDGTTESWFIARKASKEHRDANV